MVRWANGWEGLVAMAANSLSAMREFFQCQIAQQAKWECPSARRDGSEWPRASKMGLPVLSAMAANGQVQAKWEYPSAQRDGSKWPRASIMGVPALSAMAVDGLARAKWEYPSAQRDGSRWPRASKMGVPALSAMAANGHARAGQEENKLTFAVRRIENRFDFAVRARGK